MTLGELISTLHNASLDPVVGGLIELLEEWRTSVCTADELHQSIERYIGNSWIANNEEHKAVYSLWSAFRDECITGRRGMTMNERLYCFSLFETWDCAKTEEDRAAIRHKIDFTASHDGTSAL